MGDHRSPLANVGCEACHGPSGPHDGVTQDATASCEGCHDAEHSINFSVAKGMPHIDHYMANDMSDRELKQRIDELDASAAAFVVELRQRDDQIARLEQEVLDARQEAGNEQRRSRLASAGASFYNKTHFS